MSRKLLLGLAPVLAVAVLALSSAAAQAEAPHWYSNGKLIPPGVVVPVETSGTITFKVAKNVIKCKLADFETIQNPAGSAGIDQLSRFSLTGCTFKVPLCPTGAPAEIVAEGLPWSTVLIPGPPIRDVIANMVLAVRCNGVTIEVLAGNLMPVVGNSVLKLKGAGTLTDGKGEAVTVTGSDKLKGPKGDEKITAA